MMVVYLIGVITALWPAHKWLKYEGGMSTYTRMWMTLGVAIFSWFSVFAIMHIVKRDYEQRILDKYEKLLKQKALLLQ